MGCVETKSASEETAVLVAEKGLNFHLQQSIRVDAIIRKFSSNGKINVSQLGRIAEILNINIYNNPPYTKIEDMFRKLVSSDGLYELKDVLVIGILLSDGKPDIKARLLYQVFDDDLSNRIPIEKIKSEVLPKLIHHSHLTIAILVAEGQSIVSNIIKNEKYVSDMGQAGTACINAIGDKLAVKGNTVSENNFVEVFSGFRDGGLTTATGWRKYLIETFIASPPKKVFLNPYKKATK